MDQYIEIYGTKIKIPESPSLEKIFGYDLPQKEQKWRRIELPNFFQKVQYNKDGDLILTKEQEEYATEEVRRCKDGFFFYNNGVPTYITGKHYFYLQWWKLEDDIYADYRDTDRRYFTYLKYWENISWCLGVIRGKKRREGASSQATSNLIYECIFYKNSNCGLISKTRDDSKDTFTDMVAFGYRQLPVFLKPKQVNKEDSVTELVFAHKSSSIKEGAANTIKTDEGHRSRINYRAPVLNAYDRGRISRLLLDEFGKLEKDVPASQLFSIISKTLIKGAKRVGFVEMPSTVNKLTKGGSEFKLMWELADVNDKKPTRNRLVRFFSPAYDGYEGFIDEYGMSVIDEPNEDQYNFLVNKWVKKDEEGNTTSEISEDDIKLGARTYIYNRRNGLEGDLLEEEIRMNPMDEVELFMAANADCIFDIIKINSQIEYVKNNPIYKRKIIFYRDEETQEVCLRDATKNEENFCWEWMGEILDKKEANKFIQDGYIKRPARTHIGVIGVDSYSNEQGGKKYGSKASAWVYIKYDIRNPDNTGLFTAHLYGRPKEKDDLHKQIMLCAEYLGFQIWYEFVSDDYHGYFKKRGKIGYLGRFPKNTIVPEKRNKENVERHYGFPTTDFALTKCNDAMISYVQHYCYKIYWINLLEDMLKYNPDKRTPSDQTVSAMIALVSSLELTESKPKVNTPLVQLYPNTNYKVAVKNI